MRMKTKNVFYMFTSVRWWKQGVGRGTALLCTVRISWVLRKLDFRIFSTQIKSTCERNELLFVIFTEWPHHILALTASGTSAVVAAVTECDIAASSAATHGCH